VALYLRYAVRSDVGLARDNNEDSVYAGPRLLAIADGMGGHAAGEVASKIVIGSLEQLDEDRPIDDLMGALHDTVVDANSRIAEAVQQRKELEGMGTTLTALRFVGSQVGLAHVGDSRAYLLRNDQLAQITHDDTYVQYLVDSGKITPDEAKDHPRKSVILRALLGTDVEPDVSIREARAGDRYLLCSDGLSDVVSPETIAETLRLPDPQEAADKLVELALRGGGPDNVTVIVADVLNARIGDRVDDTPIVAGAFVDPAAADAPGPDSSPAQRAKALTPRPTPTDQSPPPAPRRRHWRPWVIAFGLIVLVVAAIGGTYGWAQTQYFVWRADGDVAIYQGVNAQFGPLKFFNVDRVTALRLDNLQNAFRSKVVQGITANSRADAEQIIKNLHGNQKPICRPSTAPTTSPTTSPAPSSSAPSTTSAARSSTSSPHPGSAHSSAGSSGHSASHAATHHSAKASTSRRSAAHAATDASHTAGTGSAASRSAASRSAASRSAASRSAATTAPSSPTNSSTATPSSGSTSSAPLPADCRSGR
jgi:protein phosphatase